MSWPTITLRAAFPSAPFAATPDWVDVSSYLLDFATKRGRNHALDQMQAGTLGATLLNTDGRFWPTNSGTTLNHIANPSAEVDAGGFEDWDGTLVRSTATAKFGSACFKLSTTNVDLSGLGTLAGYHPCVEVGKTYTLSVYAALASAGSKSMRCRISWRNSADATISTSETVTTVNTTDFSQRLTVSGTAPATAVTACCSVLTNGALGVFDFYADGWQFEQGPVTAYCDGAQTGCYWNGTAHASRSHRGGSPYWPDVLPVNRVNLRANYAETDYDLYTGFATSWLPTRARDALPVVTLAAVDLRRRLGRMALNNAGYASEGSDERIGNVLDSLGWPAADRALSNGDVTLAASGALANVNALAHIQAVEAAEHGYLFLRGDGYAVWHGRSTRTAAPYNAIQCTFGDGAGALGYEAIEFEFADDHIYNDVRCTISGGVEQATADANSDTQYGTNSLSKTGLILTLDTAAETLANLLLSRYKDAKLRVRSITINPQSDPDNLWPQVLGREIGDRIAIKLSDAYLDGDFHVEGIEHRVTRSPRTWRTKWWLSEGESGSYWVLGTSQLGTGTILGY